MSLHLSWRCCLCLTHPLSCNFDPRKFAYTAQLNWHFAKSGLCCQKMLRVKATGIAWLETSPRFDPCVRQRIASLTPSTTRSWYPSCFWWSATSRWHVYCVLFETAWISWAVTLRTHTRVVPSTLFFWGGQQYWCFFGSFVSCDFRSIPYWFVGGRICFKECYCYDKKRALLLTAYSGWCCRQLYWKRSTVNVVGLNHDLFEQTLNE